VSRGGDRIAASARMSLLIEGLLNLSRVTRAEIGHKSVDLSSVSTRAIDRSSA